MHVSKTRSNFPNLAVQGALVKSGRNLTANTASGIKVVQQALLARTAVFKIDTTIVVTAALDYASVKLCDLPTGQAYVIGARANLVASGTGTGFVLSAVDVAVGSVAASNVALTSTMADVLAKIDAVTVTGLVQGSSAVPVALSGTTPDLFLNVSVALTADGTVRLVGTLEVTYLDLGNPAV